MKLWDGGSRRWIAFALLIGGWCAGWLWFLLALTWGMPGILSMESDRGAFELLEFAAVRPYPQVLVAVFLFFMLPPLLLGAMRNGWDGGGGARAALAWTYFLVAGRAVVRGLGRAVVRPS